jgi:hypothetical protein
VRLAAWLQSPAVHRLSFRTLLCVAALRCAALRRMRMTLTLLLLLGPEGLQLDGWRPLLPV